MSWWSVIKARMPFNNPLYKKHIQNLTELHIGKHKPKLLTEISTIIRDRWYDETTWPNVPSISGKVVPASRRGIMSIPAGEALSHHIMVDASIGMADNPPAGWAGFVLVSKETLRTLTSVNERGETISHQSYKRIILYDPDKTYDLHELRNLEKDPQKRGEISRKIKMISDPEYYEGRKRSLRESRKKRRARWTPEQRQAAAEKQRQVRVKAGEKGWARHLEYERERKKVFKRKWRIGYGTYIKYKSEAIAAGKTTLPAQIRWMKETYGLGRHGTTESKRQYENMSDEEKAKFHRKMAARFRRKEKNDESNWHIRMFRLAKKGKEASYSMEDET